MKYASPISGRGSFLLGVMLLWIAFVCSVVQAAVQPDVIYKEKHNYRIGNNATEPTLESTVEVWQTFLSDIATNESRYFVGEQFHGTVSRFEAKFNDERISEYDSYLPELKDAFLSDFNVKYFDLPRKAHKGDSVYYTYSKVHKGLAFFPIVRVPNENYTQEFVLTVEHPEDARIVFDVVTTHPGVSYTIDSSKRGVTRITFPRLEMEPDRDYYPFTSYHAAIMTHVWRGGKLLTTTAPQRYADWYLPYLRDIGTLDRELIDSLKPFVERAPSQKEKLRVLYDYVRKSIHYIADEVHLNAFVPRPPNLTCQRLYGDCKDRAFLLSCLGRHFGIPVSMTLINTNDELPFQGVHIFLYNHAIAHARLGDEDIFLDPTAKYCDFGNLPENEIGKRVLIMDSANPRTHIINLPRFDHNLEITARGDIASLHMVKARIIMRNDLALFARYRFENNAEEQTVERYVRQSVRSYVPGIEVQKASLVLNSDSVVIADAEVSLADIIIPQGNSYVVSANLFSAFSNISQRLQDSLPIYYARRFHAEVNIELTVPQKVATQTLNIGNPNAMYCSARIEQGSNATMKMHYVFHRPERVFGAERKEEHRRFMKEFLDARNTMFSVGGMQ